MIVPFTGPGAPAAPPTQPLAPPTQFAVMAAAMMHKAGRFNPPAPTPKAQPQ